MSEINDLDVRHLYMTLGKLESQQASNLEKVDALKAFVTNHMNEEEENIKSINKKIGILALMMILVLGQSLPWGKLVPLIIALA